MKYYAPDARLLLCSLKARGELRRWNMTAGAITILSLILPSIRAKFFLMTLSNMLVDALDEDKK